MSTWWQLLRSGVPVGFYREVGRAAMYSRDGYAWSGQTIEWERRLPETGLRDQRSGRVFHGDVIRVRASAADATPTDYVVLRDSDGVIWLGAPHSMRLARLDDRFPPPTRARAQAKLGSVWRDAHYRLQFDGSLGALERLGTSPWPLAWTAAASLCGGLFLAGAVQVATWGRVEPLSTVVGAAMLLVGALVLLRRKYPEALGRHRLLVAANRAGVLVGIALGCVYGVAAVLGLPGLPEQPGGQLLGSFASLVLGYLLGLALTAIVGNSLQHYLPGEQPHERAGDR